MLVLSRKVGEKIVLTNRVGTRIEIMPVRINGGKVRIGVEAPDGFLITREEPDDIPIDDDELIL